MQQDFGETETIEQKEAAFDEWIKHLEESGEIKPLGASLVKVVFENHGANFEILDAGGRASLSGYSNKAKHLGMEQVWGEKRAEFRTWCEEWIKHYEEINGELPQINFKKSGNVLKTEGMRQFFGELTAYATNTLDFEDLKEDLEKRFRNFKKPIKERETIIVPGHNISKKTDEEKPFAPASIPPGFPISAWGLIKSW